MKTPSLSLTLALTALVALVAGCTQPAVEAPTSFGQYSSKDGTFQCEYPETWEVAGGGKRNSWATFKSGSAAIQIWTDVAGSMIGDIANNFGGGRIIDDPAAAPVIGVHAMGMDRVAQDFKNLSPESEPELFECTLGPACRSVFSASTAFGTKLKGYHATVLAKDKRVVIACSCAAADWEALQPTFQRVLESFARGRH